MPRAHLYRLPLRILLMACMACAAAFADPRYIDDTRLVPLRSDASSDSGTIHPGLPRGSAVDLVREESAIGWSLVRTSDGVEGWLPSIYVKRSPGPRYQVVESLRMLGQPADGSVRLDEAIAQLQRDMQGLRDERDALQAELAELRKISSNATNLDRSNRQLGQELQILKNELSVAQADNQRLRDSEWQNWFIMGCVATGVGGLLTLIVSRFAGGRKRRSEWY